MTTSRANVPHTSYRGPRSGGGPAFRISRSRPASHVVQLCDDEAAYAAAVGEFVASALAAGHPALVVATEAHRTALLAELTARDAAPEHAVRDGRLAFLDAHETLAAIAPGGSLDGARFKAVIGHALDGCEASGAAGPVFAHGEVVDLLCARGDVAAAERLEAMWNELAGTRRFHLLCTYAAHAFARAEDSAAYDAICARHTHVLPSVRDADEATLLREMARLEQRARALESEIARRQTLEGELRAAAAAGEWARAAVLERERDLTDCLENAAEAIHWVGPDGTILWANRAELAMLGYDAGEYVGRHITEFHADPPVIEDILCRLAGGDVLKEYEARLRHKDGSVRVVLINSNVLWRDGQFVHTRCFTRDVTEAREAAAERERLLARERAARAEAEAASRAKTEFLAVMSHELRTPLNAIGGYVELLEMGLRGPLTPAQRDDLARIRRSQLHLLGLIDEVLNYARIEGRAVEYRLRDVPVAEIVASAEALVRPQIDAKGLRLVVAPCADGTVVRADPEKARQILLNLLSNAIKFTDRGGEVGIRCERTAEGAAEGAAAAVLLRVSDTGRGIPPDRLEAIFEPFVQVDAGLTRVYEGAGLGLAISRDLARGMGGDVTAESALGAGSTFTVALPAAAGR